MSEDNVYDTCDVPDSAPEKSLPEYLDDNATGSALAPGFVLLPILQKLSINLIIPFFNGIMLGFGEIFAHELGLVWGWRSARVYDPTQFPATKPRARRKWLFGLW